MQPAHIEPSPPPLPPPPPDVQAEPRRAWLGGDPLGGVAPPPTWMEQARRHLDRRVVGGILAATGGVALVAGSFLPWVTADFLALGVRDGSGWTNVVGNVSYGPGITAVGVGICFLAIAGLLRAGGRWFRVLEGVLALVAVGGVTAIIVDVSTPGAGVTTRLGSGVWTMIVGAVLATVGWALGAAGARPTAEPPDRRAGPSARTAIVPHSGAVGADG